MKEADEGEKGKGNNNNNYRNNLLSSSYCFNSRSLKINATTKQKAQICRPQISPLAWCCKAFTLIRKIGSFGVKLGCYVVFRGEDKRGRV